MIVIATRGGHEGGIVIPPEPESQRAELRERRIVRGREAWVAATSRRYGAWECWWAEAGWNVALFTSASQRWTESAFLAFVESLVPRG